MEFNGMKFKWTNHCNHQIYVGSFERDGEDYDVYLLGRYK